VRQIIGPDVSFYQDNPGTPQEINFVRMNQTIALKPEATLRSKHGMKMHVESI
jgi:hypothetical protein